MTASTERASPHTIRADDRCDVLIVEDDVELLSAISESLEDAGHTVMTARDGEEALARCQARRFDVVVVDVRLPRCDGVEVLKQLRRSWPETKVILMTAFADVAQAVAALKEGAF